MCGVNVGVFIDDGDDDCDDSSGDDYDEDDGGDDVYLEILGSEQAIAAIALWNRSGTGRVICKT